MFLRKKVNCTANELHSCEKRTLYEFADNVAEHDMALLDARRVGGGHIEQDVRTFLHLAAGLARHSDDFHAHLLGHLEGVEDVLGVAGGGNAHDDVTSLGGAAQQAREDEVVAVIVAHSGEVGGVAVEGFGVEGRPVEVEAAGELGGEVLRVGGAATVAAEMDFAAAAQGGDNHVSRLLDALHKFGVIENRLLRGDGLLDGLGDTGVHNLIIRLKTTIKQAVLAAPGHNLLECQCQ